jgi:ferredoxin
VVKTVTEGGDNKGIGNRRGFFTEALRAAGEKAADRVIGKLRRAGDTWGENFVPSDRGGPVASEPEPITHAGAGNYDRPYFRPPGAVREAEFLEMCSTCRKCVDVCPEYCIVPAQSHMGAPVGTPIMFPNDAACTLCGDCMDVCPSGALVPVPADFVRIGLAHISEQTCIAYTSEHCSLCHEACPVVPNAVRFPDDFFGTSPWVDADACTGCGLCVKPCPTSPKSVEVRLRPLELDVD